MNINTRRFASILTAAALLCAVGAMGEVTVSVTLTGSVDEMLPILQHLKDMGVGMGVAESDEQEDPLRLHVYSITTPEEAKASAAAPGEAPAQEAAPQVKPIPPLSDAKITPAALKPGQTGVITVMVHDPQRVIDTVGVSATALGAGGFDLYDDGTHGDVGANDGQWTGSLAIPGDAGPGDYTIAIAAYDVNGNRVTTDAEDGTPKPVVVQANVTIAP